MGKVLFLLKLQQPKVRKKQAPPEKRHKDVTKYSRKQKHKAQREEAPGNSGASCLLAWDQSPPHFAIHFLRSS